MARRIIIPMLMITLAITALSGCTANDSADGEQASITFMEFFDPACPYCAEMAPMIEGLEVDYADRLGGWEIIDVTTDEGKLDVEEYGIFITPTFVILDADGEEMDRVTGATTEANMIAFIDRGIADALGEATGPRPDIDGEGSSLGDEE